MQYVYHVDAGNESLSVDNEVYKYLFKARRHKVGEQIAFRNLKDNFLYTYEINLISKRDATLSLSSKEEKIVASTKKLHLIWSVVDTKTIEKQLPYLNEIGVDKISFFYADYSQKNFKLNFDKYEKILINSSQQCGRSNLMQLETIENIETYLSENSNTYMLNFSAKMVDDELTNIETIMIGCEGGFSKAEVDLVPNNKVVGLKSNLILKSETAITAVAAKILL